MLPVSGAPAPNICGADGGREHRRCAQRGVGVAREIGVGAGMGRTELAASDTTNTTGIDDAHIDAYVSFYAITAPLFGDDSAFRGWNKVYIPYCTGDMQMGSKVGAYVNPDDNKPFQYKHVGHQNMVAVSGWMNTTFPAVPRLAMFGVSSGGTAALANYHLFRSRIRATQCGYLLNDSGPLRAGTRTPRARRGSRARRRSTRVAGCRASSRSHSRGGSDRL